ncbi:MAG: MinD/ParA family protein [Anaerolineae bacterium]|nr:MinD/ParA family protein [Anaerolineae bacterium]
MATIISVHSYRGGTGKSNTSANLAAVMAASGRRVGIVDTDIQSPGIHIIFGIKGDSITKSLNDYLLHDAKIEDAVVDVTPHLGLPVKGKVYLVPSSIHPTELALVLRDGYDVERLTEGFKTFIEAYKLDVLVVDTHPGLNEETLLTFTISDALAIVMRPDQQDYEGTGVTLKIAQMMDVPRIKLVVNKVPPLMDMEAVKSQIEEAYSCEVAALLPHSNEMMMLASGGVFSMRYPEHPMTKEYKELAANLLRQLSL